MSLSYGAVSEIILENNLILRPLPMDRNMRCKVS